LITSGITEQVGDGMVSKVIYMTPEGQQKLEQELEYLSTVKRREVAQRLHEAPEDGDGPEDNVAYEVAKNDQAFLEWRIREIEEKLARARLLEPCETVDKVRLGSKVVVQERGGSPETFIIVGTAEALPREGTISYESPLGLALLDHYQGDEILVDAPTGQLHFHILSVC
jgi:transcription elongation factor GreA